MGPIPRELGSAHDDQPKKRKRRTDSIPHPVLDPLPEKVRRPRKAAPAPPPEPVDTRSPEEKLLDVEWRMNNLYHVLDEDGRDVLFTMRPVQRKMFGRIWHRNVVLKSRQHGSTTFWLLLALDAALFQRNYRVAIIADDIDNAKRLLRRIKFAYQHLPVEIQQQIPLVIDNKEEVAFGNGSTIVVDCSARSGTFDYLLVTEFGRTAAIRPDVAGEVVSGSFQAVHQAGIIVVESTAMGTAGRFFDICEAARKHKEEGRDLTPLDFAFSFYPWHEDAKNKIEGQGADHIVIHARLAEYFNKLRVDHGIDLSIPQQRWYVKKEAELQELMKREHPSVPEEAFAQVIEGSIYGRTMTYLRENGRVGTFAHDPGLLVDTAWDLGRADNTAIIFIQTVSTPEGAEHRFIRHYSNTMEWLEHYATYLDDMAKQHGYRYGKHYLPHDIMVQTVGEPRTRLQTLQALGLKNIVAVPQSGVQDGINEVRKMLRHCSIDAANCEQLIKSLDHYRWEWNDRLATFKDSPLHDWASHDADAVRTYAMGRAVRTVAGTAHVATPMRRSISDLIRKPGG